MFALLSTQPAVIAKLTATDPLTGGHSAQGGPVEVGVPANLCVFDPAATTVVDPARVGQSQPQHALRRTDVRRRRPSHRAAG